RAMALEPRFSRRLLQGAPLPGEAEGHRQAVCGGARSSNGVFVCCLGQDPSQGDWQPDLHRPAGSIGSPHSTALPLSAAVLALAQPATLRVDRVLLASKFRRGQDKRTAEAL